MDLETLNILFPDVSLHNVVYTDNLVVINYSHLGVLTDVRWRQVRQQINFYIKKLYGHDVAIEYRKA